MAKSGFDLVAAAHQEMINEGFQPDFEPDALRQLEALRPAAADAEVRDLRSLLWSSIDNDTSRDLDQAEVAERVDGGIRLLVAIADVDADVPCGTPIDRHAAAQTTSVYAGVCTFPMLPERLSTDLTSLNQGADRLALVTELVIRTDGVVTASRIYRALIRNRAQLTYSSVGPWLEGHAAPPPKVAASEELAAQLRLQDEAARLLQQERTRMGALHLDRAESQAVIAGGEVHGLEVRRKNRASELIENLMVAANGVMAQTLLQAGVSSIRRVVRVPQRWPRIVEVAAKTGDVLPPEPDSGALNEFLLKRKAVDPAHYADVSLAVMKLLGAGEYVLSRPGDPPEPHFALAAQDYAHSTAPNRRFADTVTQRLIKAVLAGAPPPYSDDELAEIARNCTRKEDAARKVERVMNKRIAAVAMEPRIGEAFVAIVTGVSAKGTFVRVMNPPAEGLLVRGQQGVDVGDQLQVTLVGTDPERGYLDFAS
jgi:exoribonuclease-2